METALSLLEEAMLLLGDNSDGDNPSHSYLSLDAVVRAHDLLLQASKATSTSMQVNMALFSDLYRALLLACHLLLEMAPVVHGRNDDGNKSNNHRVRANDLVDEKILCLDQSAVFTLYRTMRRCVCVLRYLSSLSHCCAVVTGAGVDEPTKMVDDNWHDRYLPRPRYSLLSECFYSIDNGERIISLHLEDYTEDTLRMNSSVTNQPDSDWYHDTESNYDTDSEVFSGLQEGQLEHEENVLLDVAFPAPNASTESLVSVQRPKADEEENQTQESIFESMPQHINVPLILHEGWLTLVNISTTLSGASDDDPPTNYPDRNNTYHQLRNTRRYCKIFHNGILRTSSSSSSNEHVANLEPSETRGSQQPLGNGDVLFALSAHTSCQPVVRGTTFHFCLTHARPVSSLDSPEDVSAIDDVAERDCRILLSCEGGLADGYEWITVVGNILRNRIPVALEEHQNRIRREWDCDFRPREDDKDFTIFERSSRNEWLEVAVARATGWCQSDDRNNDNEGNKE